MPKGKGGFHTIGLYLDVFTQHVWGFKYSKKGSGRTTASALNTIYSGYMPYEEFMSNQGTHFDCQEVRDLCDKWGGKTHTVTAYSLWINGLVEGTNKLLIHVLKRLCALIRPIFG